MPMGDRVTGQAHRYKEGRVELLYRRNLFQIWFTIRAAFSRTTLGINEGNRSIGN